MGIVKEIGQTSKWVGKEVQDNGGKEIKE